MKGFINEFNERTNGMIAQITELEFQLKEKDKTIEELRWVVITPDNPFGDITKEEFKMITDSEF